MTAVVLVGCAVTLWLIGRVLIAAAREQWQLAADHNFYRRSVSPDEVTADAAELNAALDTLLDGIGPRP